MSIKMLQRTRLPLAIVLVALLLLTQSLLAQVVAFPGALGFGAYATGGRNGTVVHVTTLADTYPTATPGSFRDAVSHSGRTIVFDVGGTINLVAAVSCSSSLTIAGQTAPGGIAFDGGEVAFAGRANIICRYIRVRPGSNTSSSGDDCISLYQATNVILDHVSLAFGPWNNIDAVTADNISVQHCIDADPTGQQFGAHTENVGAFWAWQYNLFANSHNRNPLAKINTVFINNTEYNNAAGYTTHTGTRFKHDIVNNYFIAGPASGGDFPWYQIDKNQSIYYLGNLYDSSRDGVLNGSTTTPYWYQGVGTVLAAPWSSWTTLIPTLPTDLAYRYDVSAVGAFPRDEVDSIIIGQVKTLGTSGPGGGLYTTQVGDGASNNGYGTMTGLALPADADNDGMPDYWELANGSDPNVANPLTNTITGYTPLENYLNFLAAPHGVTRTNAPVDINLSQFTTGFAAGAVFSLTNATNGAVSLLNATNAHFVPTANFSGLGSFNFTVTEGAYQLSVLVAVCITPLAPPPAAAAFNGALVMAGTNSAASVVSTPSNLNWRGDGILNAWNTTTSNWLNGASAAAFKNGDVVTIDDTGFNTPALNVSGSLSPGGIIFNDNNNYTVAGGGAWSGSGSLTKTGAGTLTIGTTNSAYAGSLSINGGTLSLVSGASLGSGNIALAGGGILGVLGGGAGSVVNGSITISGGDNVTIYSGQLATTFGGPIISADTSTVLNISNSVSLGGTSSSQFSGFLGTVNIPSGATVRFSANSSGNTYGSVNPNFIINGTLQPRNAGNSITLGALNGSGLLTGPQSNAGTGGTVYNSGAKNIDSVFTGSISSNSAVAGSLVHFNKVGTGTQTLTGNNTYAGTNGILAGALIVNGSNQPSLTTVFTNALLGGTGVISGAVSVNAGGKIAPGPAAGSPGTLTINGGLTVNSAILNFDLSGSSAGPNDHINLNGTLAMTGTQLFNFNLTDNTLGAGTYGLIEGATNSTASGVTLAANLPPSTRQTFSLARPTAGSNPSYVRLIVGGTTASLVWSGANGGTWDVAATTNWLNGGNADVFYNLDSVVFNDAGANPSLTLSADVSPASIVVNATQNYAFAGSGTFTGSGTLTKSGSGTLNIAMVNNAYTGNIFLLGGTLALGSGASLGTGALTISNGATLALPAGGSSVAVGGTVFVPAGQTANVTSGLLPSGFSGNFTSGDSTGLLNLAGGLSFSGPSSAQFDGFTGTINLQPGGEVRFSAASSGNSFGSLSPTLIINGTLHPRNAGNTIVLGAFTGSGQLSGAQSASGTGDTLYLIGGDNADANFSGIISSNSAVAGSDVTVNKIGTGRLTLTGANTYNHGTTVNGGTLRVNNTSGSGTGFGDLEIFAGATLTGKGFITSATTLDDGATLAPGDRSGTLTFSNNLTLSDNCLLSFSLGTNGESVLVNGSLFLTGRLTVTNSGGFGPGSYTLFTCTGTLTFDDLFLVSAPAGYNYTLDTSMPGVVKLVVASPVPPSFAGVKLNGTTLTLSGSNGTPLGNYYVLQSSNLMTWKPIATNQFDANGGFSFTTNTPGGLTQGYFRLQLP